MNWISKSIARQGLLIVVLPLFCAVLLVLGLRLILAKAWAESAAYARSRAVIEAANQMGSKAFDTGAALYVFTLTQNEEMEARFERSSKALENAFRRLQKLAAGKESEAKQLARMERLLKRALVLLEETRMQVKAGNRLESLSGKGETRMELQSIMRKLIEASSQIQEVEESRLPRSRFDETSFRRSFDLLLCAGIAFNVLLAVFLSHYFSAGISSRIKSMEENVRKLSRKEALLPLLSGNDEIAFLDKSFHEMADKLTEAERMKQSFIAMISHELRSPLQMFKIYLQMLKRGHYGSLSQEGLEATDSAEQGSKRLINLVNEILDVEKLESGTVPVNIEPADLSEIARSAISIFKSKIQELEIKLVFQCPASVPVEVDSQRIEQVLVNFLSNAIKFSGPKSTIEVRIQDEERLVRLSVIDQGCGISPQELTYVFERFFQAEAGKKQGGSGLGLAICKAIMNAHGGQIGAESSPGKGSCFFIIIPRELD